MAHTAKLLATLILAVLATLAFAAPAQACEAEPTVHYIVTADEQAAVDLGITYQDNLDYELDHVRTDPDAELGCDARTLTDVDGYVYSWYECVVPASEAPQA